MNLGEVVVKGTLTLWKLGILFSFRLLLVATICTCHARSAIATPPMPPTVIRQEDGKWKLQDDYVGGSRIFVVDADDHTKLLLGVKDAIPESEYQEYVHETTAGPSWADCALSYFVTVDNKPYFCIRTWWDRRILIDLVSAKQIPDGGMAAALEAAEKKEMIDALKVGFGLLAKHEIPLAPWFRLQAAAHLAGRIKDKEAVQWLRRLEPLGFGTSSTIGEYGPDAHLRDGDVSPQNYSTHQTRRIVQLALRRLGEKPTELPVTSFRKYRSSEKYKPRTWDAPRLARVSSIKASMKPEEVLDTIGPPDYVESGQNIRREGPWPVAWRYDMDAEPPYTLLLVWENHQVKTVEKISPALWTGNALVATPVRPALIDADGSIRNAKALYTEAFRGTITRLK